MENEALYGQQNFSLPHDVVKLPTGGLFYKSKKKSVKVGYLTAADENIIMGGNESKDGVIMSLLRNKIYEPDLKPEELLDGDIQAILIFLRNTSFGPEYNFTLTDPETGKQFKTTILLDELSFKQTSVKPHDEGYFITKLPKSGFDIKIKPLSFGESDEIENQLRNYYSNRIPPRQTYKLNKMIIEINGNVDKGFIAQTIENLPIMDAKYIRNFMNENEPGLDLNRKIIAPSGNEVSFQISFGVDFFRPFF
jgi:hypothetical protein